MAYYCTRADMLEEFTEDDLILLTDRNDVGLVDDAILDKAIIRASAEIDGYLGAYPLPLPNIPFILVGFCCDIAMYYLYDKAMIDTVETRYKSAIKYLQAVAKGDISLGLDTAGDVVASENIAEFSSAGNMFSRNTQGSY